VNQARVGDSSYYPIMYVGVHDFDAFVQMDMQAAPPTYEEALKHAKVSSDGVAVSSTVSIDVVDTAEARQSTTTRLSAVSAPHARDTQPSPPQYQSQETNQRTARPAHSTTTPSHQRSRSYDLARSMLIGADTLYSSSSIHDQVARVAGIVWAGFKNTSMVSTNLTTA
jgi:hypothetical protein